MKDEQDAGRPTHPHPSQHGNSSHDTLHSSAPSPSLSPFIILYKYHHFLATPRAICAVFTILFTLKLPLLYNSLAIFTFPLQANPLGAQHTLGSSAGLPARGSSSLLCYFKLDVC